MRKKLIYAGYFVFLFIVCVVFELTEVDFSMSILSSAFVEASFVFFTYLIVRIAFNKKTEE